MKRVYRILRDEYSNRPLNGEGSFQYGGRWSQVGTRIAYTAQHLSLAVLEYLVHIEMSEAPADLVVIAADIPKAISRTAVSLAELPSHWRMMPAPPELTRIGDRFVTEGKFAILTVPSALVPRESNWLINPAHRDFPAITLREKESFTYDCRFFT